MAASEPRHPTSHEQRAGESWDASYRDGRPPWDIGEPQPVFVRLAAEGAFSGAVLDAGCGTGENALHVAALGLDVLGVDVAPTALETAREKAAARGIDADFQLCDALQLERLGRTFDTVLDCGLFHTFDSDERRAYVASLASVTRGTLYVLCFRDDGSDLLGPHSVSEAELRAAFTGWRIASITPDRLHTRLETPDLPAWLVKVERTMALIQDLDFIGIPSRDADRARAFYRDVLGMRPDDHAAYEQWAGSTCFGVWEPERVGMEFVAQTGNPLPLRVEDVHAARKELEEKGVTFFGDTLDTGVCHMAIFADPDGNQLMLHHRYAPYPDA